MTRLTVKQTAIFDFIKVFIAKEQMPPTFQDIADNFGFAVNAALCHVRALEKHGVIHHRRGRARGITVINKEAAPCSE